MDAITPLAETALRLRRLKARIWLYGAALAISVVSTIVVFHFYMREVDKDSWSNDPGDPIPFFWVSVFNLIWLVVIICIFGSAWIKKVKLADGQRQHLSQA